MSPPDPATTSTARLPGSTLRLLALGGLGVGAVLALVAGSRPWWRAAGTGVSVSFSGTDATGGLAQAIALVVLAGALLALVLRRRGRRVLGMLLALAGAGAVVVGLSRPRPTSGTVQSRVLEVSLADQFALVGTPWPYVYALAGLVLLAAALLTTVTAARWPGRADRYERAAATGSAAVVPASSGADDPAALWRLLDAGVDPTDLAGTSVGSAATAKSDAVHMAQPSEPGPTNHPSNTSPAADEVAHPSGRADVHEQPSGVTMKPRAAARTDEQPT